MAKPNPQNHLESQKKLQLIGANLHRIRTEQGLSLDAIAQKTKIAKRVLIAIEQGEIDQLPEPFYTKALIKKYARSLGVTDIPDFTMVADAECENIQQSFIRFEGFQLHSIHLYLLYLVLVLISVRVITFNLADNTVMSSQETIVDSNRESPNLALVEDNTQSHLVSRSNTPNSDEVIVDVDLKDRCWMKVIVDGNVRFEGTLPAGTHRTWKGKQQITIVAGNAGGVVVTYNHGKEKLLGKPGQVQEVTYKKID